MRALTDRRTGTRANHPPPPRMVGPLTVWGCLMSIGMAWAVTHHQLDREKETMSSIEEATAVRSGVHKGIEWKILVAPFKVSGNGYVKVPADHPWFDKDCEPMDIEVHGGVTYGCDDAGWVGFDTMHAWDNWSDAAILELGGDPSERYRRREPDTEHDWTVDLLVAETVRLADQAAEALS